MATGGLTPFVGREDELRLLVSRWERAREGEGQVALIIGEAEIGKSRVVQRFHEQIAEAPHTWLEAGAGAFFHNTPFYPVVEILRRLLGDGAVDRQLAQLETRLAAASLKPAEAIPLLVPLLNLPPSEKYPASTLPPAQQRKRLLAILVEWMLGSARTQPLITVIEDLHWADPSTLEWIQLLVEQGATTPLLLIYTARPEFRPPWSSRAHHMQLTLNRLSARDVRAMVAEVAAAKAFSDATVATVVERTGGVPLFVEELTRAVLESGDGKPTANAIPATLHDSLMARLDRLGPAKEVMQIGAVMGGEFSYGLLYAVHPIHEEDLQSAIRSATDAELVYARGIPPDATYQFKHTLVRDAAYEALLKSRRKELHSRIADVLVQHFPEKATLAPELPAHHYAEAGLHEQAIPYWERAGRRALERSASKEAISHFTRGLELLKATPYSPEHIQQELSLQTALGTALIATKGFSSAEVEKVYAHARELSQSAGETSEFFQVLFGLWLSHATRGEYRAALEFAEQCLRLGRSSGDSDLLLEGHHAVGTAFLITGKFVQALEHLEQTVAIYDQRRHLSHSQTYGHDPAAVCLMHAAQALWLLGSPDQALKKSGDSLALARRLAHPSTSATVAVYVAQVHQMCGNVEAVQELTKTAIEISNEHEFAYYKTMAMLLHGWVLFEGGQGTFGIGQMESALEAYRAMGAVLMSAYFSGLLAEGSRTACNCSPA